MGFTDSMKKIIGLEEMDEDEIVTDEELEAAKSDVKATMAMEEEKEEKSSSRFRPSFSRSSEEDKQERRNMTNNNMDRKYSLTGTTGMKLLVIEPKNFEECKTLVDNLKAKKPIIINLEKLETEIAKKIFDFLSGATYALNGTVTKVTNNIFIFAPANVGITESKDERTVTPEEQSPWR